MIIKTALKWYEVQCPLSAGICPSLAFTTAHGPLRTVFSCILTVLCPLFLINCSQTSVFYTKLCHLLTVCCPLSSLINLFLIPNLY